jgi:hypothetical protein
MCVVCFQTCVPHVQVNVCCVFSDVHTTCTSECVLCGFRCAYHMYKWICVVCFHTCVPHVQVNVCCVFSDMCTTCTSECVLCVFRCAYCMYMCGFFSSVWMTEGETTLRTDSENGVSHVCTVLLHKLASISRSVVFANLSFFYCLIVCVFLYVLLCKIILYVIYTQMIKDKQVFISYGETLW